MPDLIKAYADIDILPTSLYQMIQAKQNENKLSSTIQEIERDKGANVAILKLKNASVAAYLISNKMSDKISSIKTHKILRISQLDLKLLKKKKKNNRLGNSGQTQVQVILESLSIAIENGLIKDLLVKAHNESSKKQYYFANKDYFPIRNAQDIDQLASKDKYYLTFKYNQDSTLVLDLADVLDYDRQMSCSSGTYIPMDTTITLLISKPDEVRLHKPSVAESFDVRLFSDAMGYSGKNPNGIIQIEAQLNFYLNQRTHIRDLYDIWNKGNSSYCRWQSVWLNRVSPYFKLAKLEENKSYINETEISEDKILLEMYRYANLDFGTDFNIYTFRSDSKLFSGNIATGLIRTTFGKDSTAESKSNATSLYLHPYFDFKFFESNRVDFNFKIGGYAMWKVSAIDPFTVINLVTHKTDFTTFIYKHSWLELGQSINLHPGGNKQTSVFMRAAQHIGIKNSFFTFQLGYSTTINNLLKL